MFVFSCTHRWHSRCSGCFHKKLLNAPKLRKTLLIIQRPKLSAAICVECVVSCFFIFFARNTLFMNELSLILLRQKAKFLPYGFPEKSIYFVLLSVRNYLSISLLRLFLIAQNAPILRIAFLKNLLILPCYQFVITC